MEIICSQTLFIPPNTIRNMGVTSLICVCVLLLFVFMGVFGILIYRLCVSCVLSGFTVCSTACMLSLSHYFLHVRSTNTQRGHKTPSWS